jgi:hypothetical protein
MKPQIRFKLPLVTYHNKPIFFGLKGNAFYGEFENGKSLFIFHSNVLIAIICIIPFMLLFFGDKPQQIKNVYTLVQGSSAQIPSPMPEEQLIPDIEDDPDFLFEEELEAVENELFHQTSLTENNRTIFIKEREKLLYRFKKQHNTWKTEEMSDEQLALLHKQVATLFIKIVLDKSKVEKHVYHYFTDDEELYKLETALMEQTKFNVPASIKLAQSALETGYGKRVIHNNYFGIKDKSGNTPLSTTTEYYNDRELKRNRRKVISKKKVFKNGKYFWQCRVKDHFIAYKSPWESFRDHSRFLLENERYHPLFAGGKNYQAWADKIGSTKYGGVGYATSPLYGKLLKGIIRRYHLDLLDF